jgi:hypothetical protein
MAINVEIMIGEMKELPSFPEKLKNEECADKFISDLVSIIDGYTEYCEPRVQEINKILQEIVSSTEPWDERLNTLLSGIVHKKYEEITDEFIRSFNNCDKRFNAQYKNNPKLKIEKKLKQFHFYFDRNDFFFKPTDFEHFKKIIKDVTGKDVLEDGKYSKREAIHFMVVYLEKIKKFDKVEPLVSSIAIDYV